MDFMDKIFELQEPLTFEDIANIKSALVFYIEKGLCEDLKESYKITYNKIKFKEMR